jgi:hypothetical protein
MGHPLPDFLKDFDPAKLTDEVVTLGEAWADGDAAASSLEETRKTVLAQLQLEYMLEGVPSKDGDKPKPLPVSQAEVRALADPRYEQHLDLMVAARKDSNRHRVRYDMGKMKLELIRSLQATMRQEMNMTRGQ